MLDNVLEIITLLQQRGWRITIGDEQEYELRGPGYEIGSLTLNRLCREGWLQTMSNGCSYVLTDAGRKAYLKSTDELGSGELIAPIEAGGQGGEG